MAHSNEELLECIQNLMGVFDTPIARLKMKGEFADEVRKIGRQILQNSKEKTKRIPDYSLNKIIYLEYEEGLNMYVCWSSKYAKMSCRGYGVLEQDAVNDYFLNENEFEIQLKHISK